MKLIKSKQCLNLDLGNDLVNMFAGFSSDATFSTMISFVSIMSLTKCKRMSMYFVLSWYTWWFAKWMTLWLSQCIFTHPWLIPISPIIPFNHMASLTPSTRTMYSLSCWKSYNWLLICPPSYCCTEQCKHKSWQRFSSVYITCIVRIHISLQSIPSWLWPCILQTTFQRPIQISQNPLQSLLVHWIRICHKPTHHTYCIG